MFEAAARYSVENAKTVLFVTAIFAAIGIYAFRTLTIEAYPDVTDAMVEVVTVYPGQSAEEVERQVSLEIERVLAGTPHLTNLRSVSVFGLSLVTARFDDASTDFDNRVHVMERLREAKLPDGVEAEIGPNATPVGQILRYTLRGPRSLRELRSIQDWVVAPRLRSVPGVADVDTFGGFERQYAVRIDPDRLANAGVTVDDVWRAIEGANANAPGGYVGIGDQEFVVRGIGMLETASQLGKALIRDDGGVPIRIQDIADVIESSVPRRGAVGRGGEDEVVEGIVLLRRGENPTVVLEALQDRIDELNAGILPHDVTLDTFYDRRDLIDATMETVGKNLLEGAILVVVIILVFLRSWKAGLIVGMVIPLALLASFIGLRALGMSANLISLGAIDFGILVESAAVVVEVTLHALAVLEAAGKGPITQALRRRTIVGAASSVSRPVGFATLIIIAGLVPLFTLERVEGRIFAPMAFTYVFVLVGALLGATMIAPAMISFLFRGKVPHGEPRWLRWLKAGYDALLVRARRARWVILAGVVAIFAALAFYAEDIGTEFLPELNEGGIYITTVFPSTISLERTAEQVPEIRERLMALPEARDVLWHIGRPEDARQTEGPNNVEFFLRLAPMREWREGYLLPDIVAELRESLSVIPGAQFNFSQPITDRVFETISGIIGQVVVKVKADDLDVATGVAHEVRDRLRDVDGVADLSVFQAGDIPQLQIRLDRARLAQRGLRVEDVRRVIDVALGGAVATEVWEGERRYSVALRLPHRTRQDPEAIGRLVIGDPANRVMLSEVADVILTRGRAFIWRENLSRFVAVKFNVRGRDLGSVVADAQAALADLEMPEGVTLVLGGEFENKQRAMRRLSIVVPLTLLAMIWILFLNFRRWRPTLMIVSLLPAAAIGAVAFLRAAGANFSVSAAVGCITLLGQITLIGVLVCTRADEQAKLGVADPVREGASLALRPVLMTVCLAAFGLVPMALSHGMGSESQRPFAISIIGGLIVGFPLVMIVLPLFYRPPPAALPEGGDVPEPRERTARGPLAASAALGLALALGLTLGLPPFAHAQQPPAPAASLAREDALLARWLEHGQEIVGWRAQIGAARFDVVTATVLPNPELAIPLMLGPVGPPADGRYSFGGELAFDALPIFGQLPARQRAAERLVDVAEMSVATELWMRMGEIRVAIIERAFADRRVDDLAHARAELAELERILGARAQAGVTRAYDAARLAALGATLARREQTARIARARAEALVLSLIADPSLSSAPVRPEGLVAFADPAAGDALVRHALARRPDLLLARRSARAFVALAARHRADAAPAPSISAGLYGHFEEGGLNIVGGINVPLPVFDRNQGLAARADLEGDGQRALARGIEARVRAEVTGALAARARARDAVDRFRASGVLATDDLIERARRAYLGGAFSVAELVDAHVAAWDARERLRELELVRALAEAALARSTALRAPAAEPPRTEGSP